mgnify:CR=1 FL=1
MAQTVEQPANQTANDDESEFEPLKGFEQEYLIQKEFPFVIKKRLNNRIIKEGINNNGYTRVYLNRESYLKHVLVAKQFLPNDDPTHKTQVDHINHDRTDYHLSNLRYVSPSDNNKNKSSNKGIEFKFIDDIPIDSTVIDFYETRTERREFEQEKYYYFHDETNDEDKFFGKITDNLYKVLHINTNKSGNEFVSMRDINNSRVSVYINRYKFQHDLL